MQYVNSVMTKSGKRSEKMIKTDKAIYRTRTPEEYDWLMEKLDEAGCKWLGGDSPISGKVLCDSIKSDSYILADKKTLSFVTEELLNYYFDNLNGDCFEVIEVSDLMENEKKTEILDKLESMNGQLKDELKKLKEENDESQTIKKVVYTTEV